jgi:hypothetical protein
MDSLDERTNDWSNAIIYGLINKFGDSFVIGENEEPYIRNFLDEKIISIIAYPLFINENNKKRLIGRHVDIYSNNGKKIVSTHDEIIIEVFFELFPNKEVYDSVVTRYKRKTAVITNSFSINGTDNKKVTFQ